ncbi:MAG: DnaB-like helicase C-terminal domain-containing protein [Christensenellales bacterium]
MDSNLSAATARSEQRFIGCLLNGDARALDSGLKAADFTDDFCRRVFSAALMLEERGQTCDLVTLTDTASDIDASAAIDLKRRPSAARALAGQYALTIKTAAQRRAVAAECLNLPVTRRTRTSPSPSCWTRHGRGWMRWQIYPQRHGQRHRRALRLTRGWLAGQLSLSCNRLHRLDASLCIAGGKLIVIGARPSVGKSALLLHLAMNALDAGRRVLLVSLEMGADELIGPWLRGKRRFRSGYQHASLDGNGTGARGRGLQPSAGDRFTVCTTARTAADVRRKRCGCAQTAG